MAIEINSWKTKKMIDLIIPISAFFESKRQDWHPKQPKIIDVSTMKIEMQCGCEQSIEGFLKDGMLHVSKIDMTGEGSSAFMYYVFRNALIQSSGELEAILIYETSEIDHLTLKDGILTETSIEL
jgi:hypothetical protein